MNKTTCLEQVSSTAAAAASRTPTTAGETRITSDGQVVLPVLISTSVLCTCILISFTAFVFIRRHKNKQVDYNRKRVGESESRITVLSLDVKELGLDDDVSMMEQNFQTLSTVMTDTEYSYVTQENDSSRGNLATTISTGEWERATVLTSCGNSSQSVNYIEDEYQNIDKSLTELDGTFQAIYSYTGLGNHEDAVEGLLSFDVGDLITEVIEATSNGWWRGQCKGQIGWFPSSYVERHAQTCSTVRFADCHESIEPEELNDKEANFYETIEDVGYKVCATEDRHSPADDQHEPRISTPSPRRRWVLKQPCLQDLTCHLAVIATQPSQSASGCKAADEKTGLMLSEGRRQPMESDSRRERAGETTDSQVNLRPYAAVENSSPYGENPRAEATTSEPFPKGKVREIVQSLERVVAVTNCSSTSRLDGLRGAKKSAKRIQVSRKWSLKHQLIRNAGHLAAPPTIACSATARRNSGDTTSVSRRRRCASAATDDLLHSFGVAIRRVASVQRSTTANDGSRLRDATSTTRTQRSASASCKKTGSFAMGQLRRLRDLTTVRTNAVGTARGFAVKLEGLPTAVHRGDRPRSSVRGAHGKPAVPFKPERLRTRLITHRQRHTGTSAPQSVDRRESRLRSNSTIMMGGGDKTTSLRSGGSRASSRNEVLSATSGGNQQRSGELFGGGDHHQLQQVFDSEAVYFDLEDCRSTAFDSANNSFRTSLVLQVEDCSTTSLEKPGVYSADA